MSSNSQESFYTLANTLRRGDSILTAAAGRQGDAWKTCTVFAVLANSRRDTNPLLCTCSRRPWGSGRAKNPRHSASVSVLSALSRWPWDLHRRVPSNIAAWNMIRDLVGSDPALNQAAWENLSGVLGLLPATGTDGAPHAAQGSAQPAGYFEF